MKEELIEGLKELGRELIAWIIAVGIVAGEVTLGLWLLGII